MTLEILQVPGCPGADLLASVGQPPSLSCRLYRGSQDGHAPSLAQLRAALEL